MSTSKLKKIIMRDPNLRRDNIAEKDLSTEWVKKGSVNKFNKERDMMYQCPECGHHAFALSPKAGWFHCWACGIWGIITDKKTASIPQQQAESKPNNGSTTHKSAHNQSPSSACNAINLPSVTSTLEDYVEVDNDTIESISDISTDSELKGEQKTVHEYLDEQGIPVEWAVKMRWGVASRMVKVKGEEQAKRRTCIAYRNYVEGVLTNVKFRTVSTVTTTHNTPRGTFTTTRREKGFDQVSAFTPCAPYNIDCLRPSPGNHPTVLYITEGEKDCLTLMRLGYKHVVSAASGAQTDHKRSFEAFEEWLKTIRQVVICADMDVPGRKMAAALVEYFNNKQVYVCHWDQRTHGKDISELVERHGTEQARHIVDSAKPVARDDIEDFNSPETMKATLLAARGLYDHGYSTGIGPVTDSHFKLFDQGGLVVVTGTPNTGKTDFLNFFTMSLLRQRRSHVCYCSFETPDKCRHAGDLTRIWAGSIDLSKLPEEKAIPFARQVMNHVTHIRMRREKPTPQAVLRKVETVINIHPSLEFLVIDPYLYLSLGKGNNENETDAIKAMLTEVQDWAHDHHIWVFIVAHPRKLQKDDGSKELEEVDMYSISGSANWANIADYVVSIKRIQQRHPDGRVKADYTKVSVLKVRDQQICVPGDIFYNRQRSGRYDERNTEQEAITGKGTQDIAPWELF